MIAPVFLVYRSRPQYGSLHRLPAPAATRGQPTGAVMTRELDSWTARGSGPARGEAPYCVRSASGLPWQPWPPVAARAAATRRRTSPVVAHQAVAPP